MYAKLINGVLDEAPHYIKKDNQDIFGYNLDGNSAMLLKDGYKPVEDVEQPLDMKLPRKIWVEEETKIVAHWVDDYVEPTLDELKIEKREEINRARDAAEQGGFEYMGKVFDSDPISCQRMACASQAMSLLPITEETPVITWTCQDNSTIDLNAQQLGGLIVALAEWSNICHQKATTLKNKINEAKTKEDLENIQW